MPASEQRTRACGVCGTAVYIPPKGRAGEVLCGPCGRGEPPQKAGEDGPTDRGATGMEWLVAMALGTVAGICVASLLPWPTPGAALVAGGVTGFGVAGLVEMVRRIGARPDR